MSQTPKFIDVTKSYLPIDPNTYPENLSGVDDAPNQTIPVVAYDGRNFMPTNYGYRSYFGTNGKVQINSLAARVDHIFVFQTATFQNFLIALTETGIWLKDSGTSGPWTNVTPIASPVDTNVHFEWTYCIVSNVLYCYQQNGAQYYTITSSAVAPFYTVTPVVPTFLNMTAQMGIFRASGRLGFWDSAGSVSWSSLDDLTDFAPSLESLAGNSIFSDVNGSITHIEGAGEGFIIYATKSIVFIRNNNDATYQWDPSVILSNSGIAYQEECCRAVPDTLQFAYTNTGIYKIEVGPTGGKAENIIPEVYDFLKKAQKPIYPRILEGRYLFLQILGQGFLNGLGQFSEEAVPGTVYYFPGSKTITQAVADVTIAGSSGCGVFNAINNADFDEQQPGKPGGPPAIFDQKAGTKAQPIWKCWISNNAALDPSLLTFGHSPCDVIKPDGTHIDLCPIGNTGRLDAMTQDSTKKVGLLGSDVYVDGIWTIERFIAVQTAIWDTQKDQANAMIERILNRGGQGIKVDEVDACSYFPPTKIECGLGRYVASYSEPQFGFSSCSFWLTRYALSAVDIVAVTSKYTSCELVPAHYVSPTSFGLWQGSYADAASACQFASSTPTCVWPQVKAASTTCPCCCAPPPATCSAGSTVSRDFTCPPNFSKETFDDGLGYSGRCFRNNYYIQSQYVYAYNDARYVDITPTPETAYCEIVGWKYTATDGTTKTTPAVGCSDTTKYPSGLIGTIPKTPAGNPLQDNPEDKNYPIGDGNGSICGVPFTPITIPGTPSTIVTWPDTTVELPPGDFLLQRGSIAPMYPDFEGAFVYDLQLKKWGRYQDLYKRLLDYQPLNDFSGGGIPYNRFGILGGVFKGNGFVYAFDSDPINSYITYGKIGYTRLGFTSSEEVKVFFASSSSGSVTLDASYDGRNLAAGWSRTVAYDKVGAAQLDGGPTGRWFNLTIAGKFDIQYIEYRGFKQSRR